MSFILNSGLQRLSLTPAPFHTTSHFASFHVLLIHQHECGLMQPPLFVFPKNNVNVALSVFLTI